MAVYYDVVLEGTLSYVNGLFKPEQKDGRDGKPYQQYSCELILDKNSMQPVSDEYGKLEFNADGSVKTVSFAEKLTEINERFHDMYRQACQADDKGVVQFVRMSPDDERWDERINLPLKDGDTSEFGPKSQHFGSKRKDVYPYYANTVFFNMSTTTDPNTNLVDTSVRPARRSPGLGVLYSGVKVRVSVAFATYATDKGNKGIKVTLNAIQKLADGERLGGDGVGDPTAVFGLSEDIFENAIGV